MISLDVNPFNTHLEEAWDSHKMNQVNFSLLEALSSILIKYTLCLYQGLNRGPLDPEADDKRKYHNASNQSVYCKICVFCTIDHITIHLRANT